VAEQIFDEQSNPEKSICLIGCRRTKNFIAGPASATQENAILESRIVPNPCRKSAVAAVIIKPQAA
jgi:hypothetical protein